MPERLDFTVHGPAVNRAARIEALTKTLGVPVLVSDDFAALSGRATQALGSHTLEGLESPVTLHTLAGLARTAHEF